MSWDNKMPSEPGRYYWRDREDNTYGICLIAWRHAIAHRGDVIPSELQILAISLWGYDLSDEEAWMAHTGENSDTPNWSQVFRTNSRQQAPDTMQFWSEPVPAPPDFPEVIKERPPDPHCGLVAKQRVEAEQQDLEREKREREMAKLREEDIREAIEAGSTLYQCPGCEKTWKKRELETVKTRSCPHCSTEFVEEDGERNCPDCNRPFTSLIEERQGCPECLGDCEEEPELLVHNGSRVPGS